MWDIDGPSLGNLLPISQEDISKDEVRSVIKKLRSQKASGPDDVPAELFRALLDDEESLSRLTSLFNDCWRARQVPSEWHEAVVTAIFKKGAPDQCDNYRPISLLCVAYKIYASIILRRLKEAGAEERLTSMQYGFRSGFRCTRRIIELAEAQKHGSVCMIALDWKRAFDSINPEILSQALWRFGVPEAMLQVIADIYAGRTFRVADGANLSAERQQSAGISQGCPLSPFLFVMTMTVLMVDSMRELHQHGHQDDGLDNLLSILYADDTLLIGYQERPLQLFLDAVAKVGARYGLELHLGKFQLLQVKANMRIVRPDQSLIEPKDSITYLGTTLSSDADVGSELNRRLGMAWSEYKKLSKVWKHSSLSLSRKLQIFQAVIASLRTVHSVAQRQTTATAERVSSQMFEGHTQDSSTLHFPRLKQRSPRQIWAETIHKVFDAPTITNAWPGRKSTRC